MSTKPSPSKKDGKEDIKKKRCSDITFAQFLSILRQTFPDQKFGEERKADFEKFQKYDTEVGFAISRVRKHLKDETTSTESYEAILFGATDMPKFETDEDDEDKIKAVEPWKVNVPVLFTADKTLGRLDVRAKTTYDRHGIVFGKKGKVSIQRQVDKNGKYDDLLWISRFDEVDESFNVEEALKLHAIPPEYVTGDLFQNAEGKSVYPTMVLYGKIGTYYLGKDFESETNEKHNPVEITHDHTAENPCFGFTLFCPNVDADNRSCLVNFGKQFFGRLIMELREGVALDLLKKIQNSDSVKDKLNVPNPKLIEEEMNSMLSGITVFVIGNPKKITEKNGRFTLNFNAVYIKETEWELDPKTYDEFMEEWRKTQEQAKPINRKSSDMPVEPTPPEEEKKEESTAPKKDDIQKAKEQREKLKETIRKGLDTLGEKADLQSLKNGGFLAGSEGMMDEVINNIINKVKKDIGEKKQEKKEEPKPSDNNEDKKSESKEPLKEEKKEEKNIQEEKKETKNEPNSENKKSEESSSPKDSTEDEQLKKIGAKIQELGLGENASKIIIYIHDNDDGAGIETSTLAKELKMKPNIVSMAVKKLLEAKILYSPSENHYSINY